MQELNINSKNKWAEHNILLTIILLIHILQSFFFNQKIKVKLKIEQVRLHTFLFLFCFVF